MSNIPINFPSSSEEPEIPLGVDSSRIVGSPAAPRIKDSLSPSLSELKTKKITSSPPTPALPQPETETVSLWDFLDAIGNAKFDFQKILQKSEFADVLTSAQRSKSLMEQAELVASLQISLKQAIAEVDVKTAEAVSELDAIFQEALNLVEAQNELTQLYQADKINISEYNAAVNEYNAKIAELNQIANQIIEEYSIPLPKDLIPSAQVVDPNSSAPIHLLTFTPPHKDLYESAIYQSLYTANAAPIREELNAQTQLLTMMTLQAELLYEEFSPDPILNRKPISQLLLPEANINPKHDASYEEKLNLKKLSLKIAGEQELARKTSDELITNLLKNFDEKRINELKDKLALSLIEQLNSHSLKALTKSIKELGSALATLPKDSPGPVVIFTLHLVENILNDVQNDHIKKETHSSIERIFGSQVLSTLQREIVASSMNITSLILAGKFLESNTGLSGSFTQTLNSLFPNLSTLPDQKEQSALFDKLKTAFLNKSYNQEQAVFLAEMGSKGLADGIFLAPASSTITSSNINQPILVKSLTSALLLTSGPKMSLHEATDLAQSVLSNALLLAPFKNTDRFRKTLENELNDLGLKEHSEEISKQTIIIPDATIANPESHLFSLLAPHLGNKRGIELSKKIVSTFEHLLKTIETEFHSLSSSQIEELLSKSLHNSFELYSFFTTLNNPASLFIYSLPNETSEHNRELQI